MRFSVNIVAAVKAMSITYSECVYVTLVFQHTERMRRIKFSCGLSAYTIFFHIIS